MQAAIAIDEEDALRAWAWRLLARLLAGPPSAEVLGALTELSGDDSPLGTALSDLASAAGDAQAGDAEAEYNALFVGVTQGELVPFASHYLTGFLNDKPLAKVRAALCALGIERAEGVGEPEDHIGFLCEVMAGLIEGTFGEPLSLEEQKLFFDDHVAPWAPRLFEDLSKAASAKLYEPVARIGINFMEIEREAFAMAARG